MTTARSRAHTLHAEADPRTVAADDHDPVAGWRRAVDRAVLLGLAGRVAALAGGWLTVAAVLAAGLAGVELVVGRPMPAAPALLRPLCIGGGAAIVALALLGRRLTRRRRPNRLHVVLATEGKHPALGQRLSSAVEFLADATAGQPQGGTARGAADSAAALRSSLRRLAVEQAAAAARGLRMVVPELRTDLGWLAAGLLLPAAVWLSTLLLPPAWGDAVSGTLSPDRPPVAAATHPRTVATAPTAVEAEPADTPAATRPEAHAWTPELAAALARITLAAGVERRLASRLAAAFAAAPGLPPESLPRASRLELAQMAAVHADCLRTILADRDLLRAAVAADRRDPTPDRLAAAVGVLDGLDGVALATIPHQIRGHRLGLAAAAVAGVADALAAAVALAGIDPAAGDVGRSPAAVPLVRATATLERLTTDLRGRRVGDDDAVIAADATDEPVTQQPATKTPATPGPMRESEAATDTRAGPTTGTVTTDPKGAAGAGGQQQATGRVGPAGPVGPTPVDQVWSLVPTGERSAIGRAAVDAVPPVYRPAIDAYYRLLLDSRSRATPLAPDPFQPSAPPTGPR